MAKVGEIFFDKHTDEYFKLVKIHTFYGDKKLDKPHYEFLYLNPTKTRLMYVPNARFKCRLSDIQSALTRNSWKQVTSEEYEATKKDEF